MVLIIHIIINIKIIIIVIIVVIYIIIVIIFLPGLNTSFATVIHCLAPWLAMDFQTGRHW